MLNLAFSGLLYIAIMIVPAGLFHVVGPIPNDLGPRDGNLSSCKSDTHCARQNWKVNDAHSGLSHLAIKLASSKNTEILKLSEGYLHATISSNFFGFIDDLELLVDDNNTLIQARSLSRIGQSDFGVNSARLNSLRKALLDSN